MFNMTLENVLNGKTVLEELGRLKNWLHLDISDDKIPEEIYGSIVISKLENVRMLDKYNTKTPSKGTLYLTATHLIFVDHDLKKETWILLSHISAVERLPLSTAGSPMLVRTKTFQSATFVIPREKDCYEMHTSLVQMSQPVHIEDLYCFHYTSSLDDIAKSAGWDMFNLGDEYKRMGVPNGDWVYCAANKDYDLCDTYPRDLYVPTIATSTMLLGSSRFRSRGRLPVLTYLHQNKASITRCSQPLSGFSARCLEDEQMLDCIRRTNPNSGFMYVVDTRPRINAMANRAAGKGYENEAFYENIKFQFLGIENIHVMRSSLQKVIETCEQKSPSMSSFLSGLESSQWLRHVRSVLEAASSVARAVSRGSSVLVHCSDGWDRTAQVCFLACLMLDPFYRTVKGFQTLIEKEWLAFGHKFSERCGHTAGDTRERSPVFTQALDAAWQLTRVRPAAFQFNERFLLALHDHAHACQFGTFVGNCQKDRLDLRLAERTFSLWGFMASHMNEYYNPLYDPSIASDLLAPNLISQNIRFWRGMYCRFENGVHPREPLGDLLLATTDHTSSLQDHINLLTRRISSLTSFIVNRNSKSSSKSKEKKVTYHESPTAKEDEENVVTGNHINNSNQVDNKLLYEKTNSNLTELACANNDHPLKVDGKLNEPNDTNKQNSLVSTDDIIIHGGVPVTDLLQIEEEIGSVALDWKTLKNIKECVCSTPFDHFSRKYHCWKCGGVFCTRCIDKHVPLSGLASGRPAPVCRMCYAQIMTSPNQT